MPADRLFAEVIIADMMNTTADSCTINTNKVCIDPVPLAKPAADAEEKSRLENVGRGVEESGWRHPRNDYIHGARRGHNPDGVGVK